MIRIQNYSTNPFAGWIRTTVPASLVGYAEHDGVRVVVDNQIGDWSRGVSVADVFVTLGPTEGKTVDLEGKRQDAARPSFPPPTLTQMASMLPIQFAGRDMELYMPRLRPSGAAWEAKFTLRHGLLFAVLWARWYPDMPGLIFAEHAVHCSNPGMPDLAAESISDFQIGKFIALQARPPKPSRLVDGQVWAASRVFALPDLLSQGQYHQLADGLVTAVGIDRIMPDGDLL